MPALLFPIIYPRGTGVARGVWLVLFVAIGLAAVVMFLMTFTRLADGWWWWPFRIALAVGAAANFALAALQIFAWSGPNFVALSADGISSRQGATTTFVPWTTITATGQHTFARCRYLGVRATRPAQTRPGWARVFRPLNRRLNGWDLSYPLFLIPSGPLLAFLIDGCVNDADARATVVERSLP